MEYQTTYLDGCGGEIEPDDLHEQVSSAYEDASELDCDGSTLDIWSVWLEGGSTVAIAVDTSSDDTAFDPRAWLNGADGCTLAYSDDSFDCTHPPPAYSCPSLSFEVIEDAS